MVEIILWFFLVTFSFAAIALYIFIDGAIKQGQEIQNHLNEIIERFENFNDSHKP